MRSALFGSFNLTLTSRWLNHEVLMLSSEPELFAAFDARWNEMMAEVESLAAAQATVARPVASTTSA